MDGYCTRLAHAPRTHGSAGWLAERAGEQPLPRREAQLLVGARLVGVHGGVLLDEGLVRRVFTAFDRDSNAKIDGTELRGALNALGLQTNNQQAAAVLQRLDAGADPSLASRP